MEIRIGFKMTVVAPAPTPMIALTYVRPELASLLRNPEALITTPPVPIETYLDSFGNRAARFMLPTGRFTLYYDNIIETSDRPEPECLDAIQHPVESLPAETLQYLLPSRYCESDLMMDLTWSLFGATRPGWERVQAICDWVHNHIEFGYFHARPTMTAFEVYNEAKGVCRDYMHLAVTFCRCMNIPARYATGYLGEIGLPATKVPEDFSAFFEAYLGGAWHAFDPRNNTRRLGRTAMAHGRDAADTALTTSFTPLYLDEFIVWTNEQTRDGNSDHATYGAGGG